MTTNQEGRQAAIRDSTSSAYGVAADWHALFDDAGISAGTFNERLLAWINAELSASYSNLVSAMQAYAEDAGYDGWEDMATLVLAMNGAETLLDGETQGLAFDFTDQSALIIDTGTPANNYDSTGIVSSGSLVGPSGKLTYTSPSNKLTMQSDGVMRYQAHNLIPYSDDLAISGWSRFRCTLAVSGESYDGTTAQVMTLDTTADATHGVFQAFAGVSGAQYVLSVIAKAGTASYIYVGGAVTGYTYSYFDLSLGVAGDSGTNQQGSITALGGGWYRCDVLCTSTTGTPDFYVGISQGASIDDEIYDGTPAGTETVYLLRAHVYRYPANADYIRTSSSAVYALPLEYSATDGSCLGLLVEEQRTNLALRSNDFATTWSATLCTVTADNAASPIGGDTTADLVTATAAGQQLFQTFTLADSTTYTGSVYAKRSAGSDWIYIRFRDKANANHYAYFNLSTGAKGSTSGTIADYTITATALSGWYRITATFASATGATTPFMMIGMATADLATTCAVSDAIWLSGAQLELGSFPTSPILTYGAAATRNADNISIATSAFPYNQPEGTVYIKVGIDNILQSNARWFVLSNNGTLTARVLDVYQSLGSISCYNGTTTIASIDAGVAKGDTIKIAAAYKTSDYAFYSNGDTLRTNSDATVNTATRLAIGGFYSGTANTTTNIIKAISYVPRRKSNAELQAETT